MNLHQKGKDALSFANAFACRRYSLYECLNLKSAAVAAQNPLSMFGLMKLNPTASKSSRKEFRMHYCGNCKSLGRNYGQSIRLFNNYDITFLGEVLSGLKQEKDWQHHFSSYNCFSIPEEENIPLHLQYTATANVLLTEMKLEDNFVDSGGTTWLWKAIKTFFRKDFAKARAQSRNWGLCIEDLWRHFHEQNRREKQGRSSHLPFEQLRYFAAPTSAMTAMIFRFGGELMENHNIQEELHRLGAAFGELVYLLDALEDFDEDVKKSRFNAIRTAFHIDRLPPKITEEIIQLITEKKEQVNTQLMELPISSDLALRLSNRLNQNLDKRLIQACSIPQRTAVRRISIGWKEKWTHAIDLSNHLLFPEQGRLGFIQRWRIGLTLPLLTLLFMILPYSAWAQQGEGGDSNCGSLLLCLCLMSLCGGGREYVVDKDCCGNHIVRERTCCD